MSQRSTFNGDALMLVRLLLILLFAISFQSSTHCEELPNKVTSKLNEQLRERFEQLQANQWSKERAFQWYSRQPWLVGCNFTPSTASNQLEFWQQDTFDPQTIDRELGYAAGLGMNTVRVYLHDLVWQHDREGLLARIDQFLDSAKKHNIRPMIVLFDDCWGHFPKYGPQQEPTPGVHNSRWVQSPGEDVVLDPSRWPKLEAYVKGVLKAFDGDERVLMWDLYNEPGNQDLHELSIPFLQQVWIWALESRPSQPLTVDAWFHDPAVDEVSLSVSDIITFHHYNSPAQLEERIAQISEYGRPAICTEYMARTRGNTFYTDMPVYKAHGIGCYNWGLVSGRTNTIYQWDTPLDREPEVWFHDILRSDGTPFDAEEVKFIKRMTGKLSWK